MSLRVWLPLNGSLENQGLDNVTVTNNGATVDNNGKIGKCYNFPASGSNLTLPASVMKNFVATNGCSVTFWIKLNAWCSSWETYFQAGTGGNAWNNYVFGILRNGTSSKICFTIYNGSSYSGSSYLTSDWVVGEWMHVAFIYETGKCKIYLNGKLDKEYTTTIVPKFANITKITIGRSNNESGYPTNCLMNDFRIYDNTLSPQEVKKISQGLVLHYPLNRRGFGQENLVLNSNTFATGSGASGITPSTTEEGLHQVIAASGNSNWHSSWATATSTSLLENTFSEGDPFTISFTIKSDNANKTTPPTIYIKSGMGYYSMSGKVTSNWSTVSYSGTWKDTNSIAFHLGFSGLIGTYLFKNWKIEKGSTATPWCPNSSDTLADTLGLNEVIEYDCSGFCNNGEYYAYDTNGSINYTSDTPKYNVSTHIASANPTQNTANGTRYLYGHCKLTNPTQMSVAFWLKPITGGYGGSTGQGYFCTTNYEYGDLLVGHDYQASAMNHRDSVVNMNDSTSTTQCNVGFSPTIGEWHHYVYTYDGQVGRGYKDGVQTGTAQFSTAKTLDSFIGVVIGFSRAGGVWRRNDACYSDFRVYATALSAEDILSLYQNEAVIESDGTIRGKIR